MALWTITFLAFDLLDSRVLFRDYWMDWFFAALAILFYVWSGWLIGQLMRSEEHTSELQSLMRISYAVFCLKKKNDEREHNESGAKTGEYKKYNNPRKYKHEILEHTKR